MRKVLITAAIGAAILAGCSKPADRAAKSADAAPETAPAARGPANPVADTLKAAKPMRKPGLWQMGMSTSAGPGLNFTMKTCVDAAHAGNFDIDKPGSGEKHCQRSDAHPIPGGWAFESICKVSGRTMTTSGKVTGDPSSGYHFEAETRSVPPRPGEPEVVNTKIDARWLGPCPAGMKGGEVKAGGFSVGN